MSPRSPAPRLVKAIAFAAILLTLLVASYVAGVHGMFSSADRRLQDSIRDPDTRANATVELATRLATAIAEGNAVFAGASDAPSCPGRYAARATSIIAALPAAVAGATIDDAATRLHDGGWTVDPAGGHRVAVRAHNRHGLEVEVTEANGSDATSIEVTVTVPCVAVPATVATTTRGSAQSTGP